MGPLLLVFPDGSKAPLDTAATTHGRGTHDSLIDSFLSRQHVSLAPVEGVEGVVMLTNLGQNRECLNAFSHYEQLLFDHLHQLIARL